jgi:hypothetical protein
LKERYEEKLSRDGEVNKTPEPVDEYTGSEAKGLSGPPWGEKQREKRERME